MQVTKETWRMREQCVPGSLSSSPAQEPGNEANQLCVSLLWYLLRVIPHTFHCIVIVLMCLSYCMCVYFSQIYQLLQGGVQNWALSILTWGCGEKWLVQFLLTNI